MTSAPDLKLSVLVADDSEEIQSLVSQLLKPSGYKVTCVSSGAEAKRLLRDHHYFDIVITDLITPDADGLELIHDVKARFPTTRILAMTGGGHVLDPMYCVKLARGMGANAGLLKPFTASQFMETLKEMMSATDSK